MQKELQAKLDGYASAVNKANATLTQNQRGLAESHMRLDSQYAVMVRVVLSEFAKLADRHNALCEKLLDIGDLKGIKVEPVTYDGLNDLLEDFHRMSRRPDVKEHMRYWYEGGDVDALPDPPPPDMEEIERQIASMPPEMQEKAREAVEKMKAASEAEEPVETSGPALLTPTGKDDEEGDTAVLSSADEDELAGFPEHADFFGGDYGAEDLGTEAAQAQPDGEHGEGKGDEVPEGRGEDVGQEAAQQ